MENNNHKKRKVMLIAAFAVAVIALAGIGYAVGGLGYVGTTVNSDNTANGKYITVTQNGDTYVGAFEATDLEVNTYTDKNNNGEPGTIYVIPGDTVVTINTNYNGVAIGDGVTLVVDGDKPTTDKYTVKVDTLGTLQGDSATGWKYFIGLKGTGDEVFIASNGSGTISGTSGEITSTSGQITVKLYIASENLFEEMPGLETMLTAAYIATMDEYYNYPAATVPPLNGGYLFDGLKVVFTVEGVSA